MTEHFFHRTDEWLIFGMVLCLEPDATKVGFKPGHRKRFDIDVTAHAHIGTFQKRLPKL